MNNLKNIIKPIKAFIHRQGIARLTSAAVLGILAGWLSRDFLTRLVLLGRNFSGRSLLVQVILLLLYASMYAAFLLAVMPKGLDHLAAAFNKRGLFYCLLLVCMAVMSYPLLSPGLSSGHDLGYHLLRIYSLKEGLLSGQVPVRVNPLFLNGYGYASALFYPDLFLYIPAFLNLAGFSLEVSYKLFLALTFLLSFITSYQCGKGIAKDDLSGGVTALVYCLSQYYLQNIYTRSALGEVQAFVFLPLIVYGLYDLIFADFERYWLLFIGFTGLFFSHLISLLIAALVCIGVCLFALKRILQDKRKVMRILLVVGLVLACTSAFWLPMLEQMLSGSFKYMQSTYQVKDSAVPLSVIFANAYTLKGTRVSFGFATLLLCLLWFFTLRQPGKKRQVRAMNWCLAIGLVLVCAVSDIFPWRYAPSFLNIIQFPWRLYGLASIFIAAAIGLMARLLLGKSNQTISLALLTLFMVYAAVNIIDNSLRQRIDIPRDHYARVENTFSINNGEWLPSAVDVEQIPTSTARVVDDAGKALAFERIGQTLRVKQTTGCQYLDLPLIYYRGYTAEVRDAGSGQSQHLALDGSGPNGSLRVTCAEGMAEGIINVRYRGTPIQKAALALNLLGAAGVVYFRRPIFNNLSGGNHKKNIKTR